VCQISPVQVRLAIVIDARGEAIAAGDVAQLVPPSRLRLVAVVAFERAGELPRAAPSQSWIGHVAIEGPHADCQHDLAQHLIALRKLSARFPDAVITIGAEPGGGVLTARAGSFGADDAELASLIAMASALELAAEGPQRLYVSFRIEADAHPHLIELVTRALPPGWDPPVVDTSPTTLALGFELAGEGARLADLIAILRLAWRQEGSEPECLIELEGDEPIVCVVETWAAWVALEQRIRSGAPAGPSEPAFLRTELAAVPVARVLGDRRLSWIDGEGRILCLADGTLQVLSERSEVGERTGGEIRRRADGSIYFVEGQAVVEIPPPRPGAERVLHGLYGRVVMIETTGDEAAASRLRVVSKSGISDGPYLTRLRALDVCGAQDQVYALSEQAGVVSLSVHAMRDWARGNARPWDPEDTPTDVAVISTGRVAVTAERDHRAMLYLVERANLAHARRIALPCSEPQIVAHHREALWITGMSPPPAPRRCDLFRVDLREGTVTVVTAELDVPRIDVEGATWHDDQRPPSCLVATPEAVFVASRGLQRLVDLARGERVTSMVHGELPVIFVEGGERGPRLLLGEPPSIVALDSPGDAPRFLPRDDA
jgi:hypothetical protein